MTPLTSELFQLGTEPLNYVVSTIPLDKRLKTLRKPIFAIRTYFH
jgi:hypothetical protein